MRIKGVVSRIFCSKPSGFKILVLEVNISQQVPQKYINPEFPASVSAAGVMKEADIGYVVECQRRIKNARKCRGNNVG